MVFAMWIAVAWLEVFRGRPNIKRAEIKKQKKVIDDCGNKDIR